MLYDKDIQFLKSIANCGISTDILLSLYGISYFDIRSLIELDFINKTSSMLYGSYSNIYTLTEKAKSYLSAHYALHPYKTDLSQLEHDFVLAKIYSYLQYEEKESYLNETALAIYYPNSQTTDGIFIKSGSKIAVEVITHYYKDSTIDGKMAFIKQYCDDYIMVHTHKNTKY